MKYYDKYPIWTVLLTLFFTLLVYVAASYVMFSLSLVVGGFFVFYLFLMEYYVYKEACPNCFYYGKRCFSGRGLIAGIIYKQGDPKKFCEKKIHFKDLIPQMLVVLAPLVVGIAILISRGFDLIILIAVLYPIFSWFAVNPLVYGKLACPHCKQGKKCCPALEFFSKKK